jgi:hypothetical protein
MTNEINTNIDMVTILDDLINQDITITARAVARLHPTFNHASSITRDSKRQVLIQEYQEKQELFRKHTSTFKKQAHHKIAIELTKKDQRILELEEQVQVLTASHVAMIRAIGEVGGMEAWLRFFDRSQEARDIILQNHVKSSL